MSELCDWPVSYAGCTPCKEYMSDLSEEDYETFTRMAAEFLWNWTNRLFGLCTVTVRPCTSGCEDWNRFRSSFWGRGPYPWTGSWDSGSWVPVLVAGKWYNMTCGCTGKCNCANEGPHRLSLPGPVEAITQVRVDGEVLPPESYRLEYKRFLVRTDGGVWPACQDLLAAPDQPNTFEVTYTKGVPVPIGGQIAAGRLASEFAKAACNDRTCQLPQRMKQIVRQEVTVTLMDDFADLKEGGTGIWLIDQWVQSMRAPRPFASVRSVDVKPAVSRYGY
ncbi:hypothetical protein PBI_DEWDROP_68 [Microbacterium phage Dewdrop]|nr:hypothetical protein PBI_LEAF_68 [Microbacterium phage Leaf]QGZ17437.1 hypothetical protein PBI_DEWDROP_68 [Microbacterium phage Dewdrop]